MSPSALITDSLKFIDETARGVFSRLQSVSLTILFLFLAAPEFIARQFESIGAYIQAAAMNLMAFFHLSNANNDNIFAVILLLIIWVSIQLATLAHDAILTTLYSIVPRTELSFYYQEEFDDIHSRNFVYKCYSKIMDRYDFETLFSLYRNRIIASEDFRKRTTFSYEIPFHMFRLREKFILALVIYILIGEREFGGLLISAVIVGMVWSAYRSSQMAWTGRYSTVLASELAALELITNKIDGSFDRNTEISERFSPSKRYLVIRISLGQLTFSYSDRHLSLSFWLWSFSKELSKGPKQGAQD